MLRAGCARTHQPNVSAAAAATDETGIVNPVSRSTGMSSLPTRPGRLGRSD